jgi:hypothetical protein
VGVSRVSPRTVTNELTHSALNSSMPSLFSQNVLHRWHLSERFRRDPEGALRRLHQLVTEEVEGREQTLFTLTETAFEYAERTSRKEYYLEAAVAAWAFLFPGGGVEPPHAFDPRLRIATDLYNRGLTRALSSADDAVVELRAGLYALPFGQKVWVHLEPDALRWADRDLVDFVPVADAQPFRPGRIPVVFVHGTASSVGRWADMLNDLLNDPRVLGCHLSEREHRRGRVRARDPVRRTLGAGPPGNRRGGTAHPARARHGRLPGFRRRVRSPAQRGARSAGATMR